MQVYDINLWSAFLVLLTPALTRSDISKESNHLHVRAQHARRASTAETLASHGAHRAGPGNQRETPETLQSATTGGATAAKNLRHGQDPG